MRRRVSVALCSLIALTFSPALLRAQFQEPTKEELQMTSDPKAPGADAVYLYREETADDQLHFHSTYVRIKVLTEHGKELATVHVPYEHGDFKVTDIKGRTIHADGTVIPLTTKPSDLVNEKTKSFQVNTMVFTLPSVEVGSILEYRLQLRYDDNWVSSPNWEVQQPYFVHKAHYMFNPSHSGYISNSRGQALTRLMYDQRVGDNKITRDMQGRYNLDVTDVPALPDEDWMPPLNSIRWKVQFYYTQYTSGLEFWQSEGKHWAKEMDHFAEPSKTIHGAVEGVIASTDTEEQKARKLYEAVQKLENTDFTRAKSEAERKAEKLKQIKSADDVWNQKGGSSDELALLYLAMARAAGLQAWGMQVVNRNQAMFDAELLYLGQLDDYLVVLKIADKEVFLDPGQKMCPYGMLHWKHTLASGLRESPTGVSPATTPPIPYTQNTEQRVANLSVAADGSASGTIRYILTGQEALEWRQTTLKSDEDEVKKRFNESIRDTMPQGVQADFDHFLALNDYNSNLLAVVKVSGSIATATGKRFFLPGLFFESRTRHPFVAQEKRTAPVDVKFPRKNFDDVTYFLPEGYTVESAPQSTDVPWAQHGVMMIRSKVDSNKVEVARQMAYNYTVLDPKDYSALHDFYQKVATADQQQLVLTRAAVAQKGQ